MKQIFGRKVIEYNQRWLDSIKNMKLKKFKIEGKSYFLPDVNPFRKGHK